MDISASIVKKKSNFKLGVQSSACCEDKSLGIGPRFLFQCNFGVEFYLHKMLFLVSPVFTVEICYVIFGVSITVASIRRDKVNLSKFLGDSVYIFIQGPLIERK